MTVPAAVAQCSPARAVRAPAPAAPQHCQATCAASTSRRWGTWQAALPACSRSAATERLHRLYRLAAAAEDEAAGLEAAEENEVVEGEDGEMEAGVTLRDEDELSFSDFLAKQNDDILELAQENSTMLGSLKHKWEREKYNRRHNIKPKIKTWEGTQVHSWEPIRTSAPTPQAEAEGLASGTSTMPSYEELLGQLPPALHRQIRQAAQERVNLPRLERDPMEVDYPNERMPRKAEPVLDEWDLRAKMEKQKRQQREMDEWNKLRAQVGQYPSLGADWRNDVRCQSTGNPQDPEYREWTHKEIWDLITANGRNADPRDVSIFVRDPLEIADAPAQGASYCMEPEEYFESRGQLIHDEDLAAIIDKDAEVALLAAEFSDFDDELGVGGADFDTEYAATTDASGGDDEAF